MDRKILYLGDTALDQAASYLAGVLSHYKIKFDYLPSNAKFQESLLKKKYDAIVISDYPASNFNKNQMTAIADKIKNGTGLLMIGGWDSFVGQNGKYNDTVLADVLPVKMGQADDRINYFGPCAVIKKCSHKITDKLPFEKYAPLIGGYNKVEVKQGCIEILTAKRFKAEIRKGKCAFSEFDESPLLIVGRFGKAKTAVFASDVSPHWVGPLVDWGNKRVTAKAKGGIEIEVGNWYAQFFINIINWIRK
jgi:uncharacterized membrane protein